MKNVGTICYTTNSGLGVLAREFIEHGVVNRILMVPHPKYNNATIKYKPREEGGPGYVPADQSFIEGLDTLLIFENALGHWDLVNRASDRGVKIVLMPMYEYTPFPTAVNPDLVITVSDLDDEYYKDFNKVRLNVPVNVPWRQRNEAHVFVHNAGHGGHGYRNGTPELIEAMKHVKSDIKLLIRAQPDSTQMVELYRNSGWKRDPRITFSLQEVPAHELYSAGDVFIFPEKFNGLSLPMQEAFASGMLVMGTDRFPMNGWLPRMPLIMPNAYRRMRIAVEFNAAVVHPVDIAAKIDQYAGQDISHESSLGREWAQQNSWEVLKPKYLEVL